MPIKVLIQTSAGLAKTLWSAMSLCKIPNAWRCVKTPAAERRCRRGFQKTDEKHREALSTWVAGPWLQPVTSVIIKNTPQKKRYQKIQTQITKKCNTEGGKIINKREIQHTLVDSRFCYLTACLKNEKSKGTKCNLWRNGKIQSAFLEVMGKHQKNTKIQSVSFVFILYFLYKYKEIKTNTK